MQSNTEQAKPVISSEAQFNVSAGGQGIQQPPPPSYAPQAAPGAHMSQSAAPHYAGGPSYGGPQYGAPQYGSPMQYGVAPSAVGFAAQPAGSQNVQVNMIGAPAPPPQTIVVTHLNTVAAPPSYMGWSIFNLLCCFWPLGLAALIFSMKVGNARTPDEAKGYSMMARNLNIAATVVAPVLVVIIVGAIFGKAATTIASTSAYIDSSCYGYYSNYYHKYTYSC